MACCDHTPAATAPCHPHLPVTLHLSFPCPDEHLARQATSALYHVTSAVILAWEDVQAHGDPRKLLVSRFVLEHHLEALDPLAPPDGAWEQAAYTLLFKEECTATMADVVALVCDSRPRKAAAAKPAGAPAKEASLV